MPILAGQIVTAAALNNIYSGIHADTVAAGTAGESGVAVNFGVTFTDVPVLQLTARITATDLVVHIQTITTTGFTYRVVRSDGANFAGVNDYEIHWTAIGEVV